MHPLDDARILALLAEADELEVEDHERHKLITLFRHRGPSTTGVREWLGRLISSPAAEAPALRAPGGADVVEVEAGPYTVILEARPVGSGALVDVHGQVFGDEPAGDGSTVVLSQGAAVLSGPVDAFGEFDVRRLPAGSYRATWHLGDARIVVEDLRLEAPDDEDHEP